MRFVLEVLHGPAIGKRLEIKPGRAFEVGSRHWANLWLPKDGSLAGSHFLVELDEDGVWIQDQNTAGGTMVNGRLVTRARLRPGDRVHAGETDFVLKDLDEPDAPLPMVTAAPVREPAKPVELIPYLESQPHPLFAILDAARSPRIVQLLWTCREEHQSLYEGERGRELAGVGPWLVRLPPGSEFLRKIVAKGWGDCWGVYLTSDKPFAEVRKFLRRFLMVEMQGKGKVYFRYYDPRVLRFFLPSCLPEQAAEMFGPVRSWLTEAVDPKFLVRFTPAPRGVKDERIAVVVGTPGVPVPAA
jgi:hypothetical protein